MKSDCDSSTHTSLGISLVQERGGCPTWTLSTPSFHQPKQKRNVNYCCVAWLMCLYKYLVLFLLLIEGNVPVHVQHKNIQGNGSPLITFHYILKNDNIISKRDLDRIIYQQYCMNSSIWAEGRWYTWKLVDSQAGSFIGYFCLYSAISWNRYVCAITEWREPMLEKFLMTSIRSCNGTYKLVTTNYLPYRVKGLHRDPA